jgi:polysaccharide pyruvyl transferase WcaK-like protein
MMGRRIALLEHCGTGNLGDDATVEAVLQQITQRWPDASVAGLSLNPADSTRRHGIPCFAIRRSVFPAEREWSSDLAGKTSDPTLKGKLKTALKKNRLAFKGVKSIRNWVIVPPARLVHEFVFLTRSLRLTRKFDTIIICGGGQLLDWGGPWAFPYTLFKWTLLAKLARSKCIFLNNGAGPLDKAASRWLVKLALRRADYVSFRDRASEAFIRRIGFRGHTQVAADCAWNLHIPEQFRRPDRRRRPNGMVIGIAPMAYCDPTRHWVSDEARYRKLIHDLTQFSVCMLRRGHQLRLFSSDVWFDSQAIADLESAIAREYPTDDPTQVVREPVADIDGFLAALSQVDCYVTCRFHGVIFSHLLNVPAIAIAPHHKVTRLMDDAGLSEYCLDISECSAGRLTAMLDRLVENRDEMKFLIRRNVANAQRVLTAQFDGLFPTKRTARDVNGTAPRHGV